jgi:hypothetical protein
MNHSGDAAEQIVRMSLEGVEVAARITGAAAKEIAVFLFAALKEGDDGKSRLKLKGRARLESMLKSGKALEIFSVKNTDLGKFAEGAKQYGIVYCVLRDKKPGPDGLCDIMVKADDAPKINRLVERFKFATVDKAKIESEITREKAARAEEPEPEHDDAEVPSDGREAPDTGDREKLLDELLGTGEGKSEPNAPEPEAPKKQRAARSAKAKTAPGKEGRDPLAVGGPPKFPPSEPTSEKERKPERTTSSRPSVKAELDEIKAARRAREAKVAKREEKAAPGRAKANPATAHRQPNNRKPKFKSKKPKAR